MDQYIEQLKPLFEKVAEKIGQGAEFGWAVIMKQQYVVAVLGLGTAIMGLVLAYIVYKICKKSIQECEKDEYSGWSMIGVAAGVAGGILSLFMIMQGSYDAITHFVNPEYYALEFFIQQVK